MFSYVFHMYVHMYMYTSYMIKKICMYIHMKYIIEKNMYVHIFFNYIFSVVFDDFEKFQATSKRTKLRGGGG